MCEEMKQSEVIDVNMTANNMKNIRMENGMTKEQLSLALNGVEIALIKDIENGEFIPTLEYVFDFCEYFNVSIDSVIVSVL